ncbi:hypothetical protein ACLSZP_09615 [Avibacterium avium]|uniref:hypothetical protein n=1 Tax=Avibacterium avium TaxID=751 RepID=UPI003BF85C4E
MLPTTQENNFNLSAISAMSVDDLKNELAKTLTVTAEYLGYVAAIWQELEFRGEDLSHLRHGMMTYIPLIATKQLDARLVVNYAGQKTLLSSLSRLPIEQQQKLIASNIIDVVDIDADNKQVIKKIALSDLTAAQIYQVLGDGEIKRPDQQYQNLLVKQKINQKLSPKKTYRMTKNIKLSDDKKVLIVAGKHGVAIDDLRDIIK